MNLTNFDPHRRFISRQIRLFLPHVQICMCSFWSCQCISEELGTFLLSAAIFKSALSAVSCAFVSAVYISLLHCSSNGAGPECCRAREHIDHARPVASRGRQPIRTVLQGIKPQSQSAPRACLETAWPETAHVLTRGRRVLQWVLERAKLRPRQGASIRPGRAARGRRRRIQPLHQRDAQ